METRGAVAAFDPATGRVTLSASTQMPHLLRTGIADVLGIPESELRVVAPEVGGGFGQKMPLIPEYVVTVWAARHFACTCRLDRGPARKPDRLVSRARSASAFARRIRCGR